MSDHYGFAQLAQILFPGGQLLRAWPLSGGISAGMTALEIQPAAGPARRLVVRRPGAAALCHNPRAAEDEFHLLRRLHGLGLAVPEAIYLDLTGKIFPSPYLVIEYVAGQPEFDPTRLEDGVTQLAAQLAAIHSVPFPAQDVSFLSAPAENLPALPARVDPVFSAGRVHAAMQAAWPIPQHNTSALLHGDYWPGNILWRAGRLAAVVDWEDAAFGDPLYDFAIARLDLLWIYGRGAMESFSQQYLTRQPLDSRALPYWDLYAALRLSRLAGNDLAGWAGFFHPYGRTDITAETIRAHVQFFIGRAFAEI